MLSTTKEQWKDIKGFVGFYQVSNMGRVRSVPHDVKQRDGHKIITRHVHGKIISNYVRKDGYVEDHLRCQHKSKTENLNQLVARAFVPNPHHYTIVNHKDENPLNNKASNLEWCSQKYNCNYGNRTLKNYLSTISKHANRINKKLLDAHDLTSMKKIFTLINGLHCLD